jgi:hypothetical protein
VGIGRVKIVLEFLNLFTGGRLLNQLPSHPVEVFHSWQVVMDVFLKFLLKIERMQN